MKEHKSERLQYQIANHTAEAEGEAVSVSSDSSNTLQPKPAQAGFTRRGFLKIIGAGAAATGAVACAPNKEEHLVARVKSDDRQIPGTPIWYASTCTECKAGCGIMAKSVDGRVIKLEGNSFSTVNGPKVKNADQKGGQKHAGMCALGHSALQNLYDPDRIRQPLKRNEDSGTNGSRFVPISWAEALTEVATALGKQGKENVLFTGEISGAKRELVNAWSQKGNLQHVVFDLLQPEGLAQANKAVFGIPSVPSYHFEKADVLLSFGCDFLETWISPVEYSRDWAKRRKEDASCRFFQVEPRLSMTGASSDHWIRCNPGTEVTLVHGIINKLLLAGRGASLTQDVVNRLKIFTGTSSIEEIATNSGVAKAKILLMIEALFEAKSSLVVAGFQSTSTSTGYDLQLAVQLLNLVLGNVAGTQEKGSDRATITFDKVREVQSSFSQTRKTLTKLQEGAVGVAMIYGTNPIFSLPSSAQVTEALRKADLVVAFASHRNETVSQADIVFPIHTSLEEWSDVRPQTGSYSLIQPAMSPIFDTKQVGDLWLLLAEKSGSPLFTPPTGEPPGFYTYLRNEWRTLYQTKGWAAAIGANGDFESFWRKAVEDGGVFTLETTALKPGSIDPTVFDMKVSAPRFSHRGFSGDTPVLLPFVHVKGWDGRAANRSWMQELPDPVTQIVWDTWGEMHPNTAAKLNLEHGIPLTLRTHYGEINIPLRVTHYVAEGVIAVPIGQGHDGFGRYASAVKGGNVLHLLPDTEDSYGGLSTAATRVEIFKARGAYSLVSVQGSDSQHGRELARTRFVAPVVAGSAEKNGHSGHVAHGDNSHGSHGAASHEGHHEPKQMYRQRVHPVYEWGMSIDLAACTGCSACVVACTSENNVPVAGKTMAEKGREMAWLRIEKYIDSEPQEDLKVSFMPMMCQHCKNAPCEPVCPVYATYHNEEGLNVMVYNRCVGTRYCSNNCSYKVRRFNWVEFEFPEPLNWQLNPQVTKRSAGVMEKCTFCVQRITEAKDNAKDQGRVVGDGEVTPACVQSCPTQAFVFGNLNDKNSRVAKIQKESRAYKVLDHHLNTQPSVSYLEDVKFTL
jgi:anaerobic selenocysteine-containing dehydrogenase/Fe-S-cluster-containing dehydrogenase component